MENDPFPRLTRELQEAAKNGTQAKRLYIAGDIAPFVSSVDGSLITGRRSLREHNKRNGVVLAADLEGLPVMQTLNEQQMSLSERREFRDMIGKQVYEKFK